MKTIEEYADFLEAEDERTEFLVRVRRWNTQIDDMTEFEARTLLKLMVRSVGNIMNLAEDLLFDASIVHEEDPQEEDERGAIAQPTSEAAAEIGELLGEGRSIG